MSTGVKFIKFKLTKPCVKFKSYHNFVGYNVRLIKPHVIAHILEDRQRNFASGN